MSSPSLRADVPTHTSTLASKLLAFADPLWFEFMGVLLLPAAYNLVCSFVGPENTRPVRFDQFTFFAGMAVYLGVLKWIGWNMLTRHMPCESAAFNYLLFPAELFCGLALCCGWFYLRNAVGRVLPAGFALHELSLLKCLILPLQIGALIVVIRREKPASLFSFFKARAASLTMQALFVFCLFAAFRDVSCALHVQSTDPLCHGYMARQYLATGISNGGLPVVYTSGFGAINAVTFALAPLTIVQIMAMQHIVLTFLMFFLVTGAIGYVLKRHLWVLHLGAIPYLLLIPIFNLPPWQHYEGAPRQSAPAIAAAFCLLPALYPVNSRLSFYLIQFSVAVLEWLFVALNPTCALFVLAFAPIACAVFCYRARRAGQSMPRTILLHAGMMIVVGALVLLCDPFYSRVILHEDRPNAFGQRIAAPATAFSTPDSIKQMATVQPLAFDTTMGDDNTVYDLFKSQPRIAWLPAVVFAWFAIALFWQYRSTGAQHHRPLCYAALAACGAWVVMDYLSAAIRGGLSVNVAAWEIMTLRTYISLLLFRLQVALLFFILATMAALLFVRLDALPWRFKTIILASAAMIAACLLPLNTMRHFRQSGFTVQNSGCEGSVSRDDLKLAAWADSNLAHEPGLLGLSGTAYRIGPETHLYPYGGSQSIVLYCSMTNYCFFPMVPNTPFGFDDYMAHIETHFDAQWCLDHNIRWIYSDGLVPSLNRAIQSGELLPMQVFGTSGIYKVTLPTR